MLKNVFPKVWFLSLKLTPLKKKKKNEMTGQKTFFQKKRWKLKGLNLSFGVMKKIIF